MGLTSVRFWGILFVANLSLFLPNATPLRVIGAWALIGFLPGLSWANRWLSPYSRLFRWTVAAALSYTFTSLLILLLHYLPGPVQPWQFIFALNLLALLPTLIPAPSSLPIPPSPPTPNFLLLTPYSLLLTSYFLLLIFLRFANLSYSEFQGDEALSMISAAESLMGHENALFLRSKGPGEVLLPMAMWQLSGTINEGIARLPFAMASVFAIFTIYLLAVGQASCLSSVDRQDACPTSFLAVGFFALNGFMVAFSRIVQYQILVVWFSSLAFLLICYWRDTGQQRFAILAGLFLGAGLLAHYDAILVLPAIIWLFLPFPNPKSKIKNLKSCGWFITSTILVALPFYLPYSLDPQANRTGNYLGGRIGHELRNNLADFFHFNSFYSSFYYIALTSLLVFSWLIFKPQKPYRFLKTYKVFIIIGILLAIFAPQLTQFGSFDGAGLPFAMLFMGAMLAFPLASIEQAMIIWLAVPFWGYNFVVALGLTHIYTIVPAWSLMAGLALHEFLSSRYKQKSYFLLPTSYSLLLTSYFLLLTLYLWNSFVRHDIEYVQDFPKGNLSLYWTPYPKPPAMGFFGFAHRAGWKAIGQKIIAGELGGDYGSNEEPEVTTWYTRGAPRACDPRPEFYFLATDLVDRFDVPRDLIKQAYRPIGQITLANGKSMHIMQAKPAPLSLPALDEADLARQFDETARPSAFARSVRGARPYQANFSQLIQLIGYDLSTQRAYAGGRVPVTLYWQALAPVPTSYQIFVHLENKHGLAAQSDGVPVCWSYPTNLWRPGQIIADQHAISLPPHMLPGQYDLQVGLYLPDSGQRLDVLDMAGQPAGTSVTLTTVEFK